MLRLGILSLCLAIWTVQWSGANPLASSANADNDLCASIRNGTLTEYSMIDAENCTYPPSNGNGICTSVDCSNVECSGDFLVDPFGCDTCDCYETDENNIGIGPAAIRARPDLWDVYTNAHGEFLVPYVLRNNTTLVEKMEILKAIEEININTCVEFVPRYANDGRHDYVEFTKDGICSSAIGRQGGKQEVALGEDCDTKGGILHELMHILGFSHEHNRHDRDQHINVNWENITPEKRPSFQKRQFEDLILKDFPYDIRSIIHFDSFAFSSNGDPTLTDLSGFPLSTQGTRLSATDIDKIKVVYGCPDFLPMPPVLPQKCVDELFLCPEQAKNCACVFAPAFMLKYCCSSCELEADEMVDRFPFCPMWKDNCGKSEVLDSFCRKTCPRCVL